MGAVIAPLLFPSLLAGTTAFNIAVAGVNIALYAGVSAASMLIQQSMLPNQNQEFGTKLSAQLGGAVNQSIIVGRKETAGSLVYINSFGRADRTPNAFLVRVYALSDRPVESFEPYVWAGGRKCTYDPGETDTLDGVNIGHPIPSFDNDGGKRLWVKFHDGSQSVADGYLRDKFGGDARWPWTADHVGRGRAYMIVTQKYDKKEPSGQLDVIPVPRNAFLYDWRNDSTNGGSGAQRYGTYSTYAADPGNPVVTIYNIMRGIYYGNDWLYGGQKWPARRFDNDSWTAAANKCDENVALAAGGTQKRFRIGAEFDLSEEPWTIIERLLKACNGRIVESGGRFKIYCGGIGSSVFSFTDDDMLASEELTSRLYPERGEIINTITGTYIEPEAAGKAKAFKARFKQVYIDADDGPRKTARDYEYVRANQQAQRLASLELNDNRRFRTFSLAFWTVGRKIEPCDIVNWNSSRFGFVNKKFIVGDVVLRGDGVVILLLREADPTDSDWETSDESPYVTGIYDDVEPTPQAIVPTFTAASVTDDDNTTQRRAAIRIRATLDDDYVDCKALRWEVRKRNGDQDIIAEGESPAFFNPDNAKYGDIKVSRDVFLPGRRVQIRVRIVPFSDRETSWSAWGTTSFYPGGNDYLELAVVRKQIANAAAGIIGDVEMVETGNIDDFAVTPRKADLGDMSNLFRDSNCEDPTFWTTYRSGAGGATTIVAAVNANNNYGPSRGKLAFTFPGVVASEELIVRGTPDNPCAPGRRYSFETYAKLTAYPYVGTILDPIKPINWAFRVDWYGLDGSGNKVYISTSSESDTINTDPVSAIRFGNFTAIAPAGAAFFAYRLRTVLPSGITYPGNGTYEMTIGGIDAKESMSGVYETTNFASDSIAAAATKTIAYQLSQHTKQSRIVEVGVSFKNATGGPRQFTLNWIKNDGVGGGDVSFRPARVYTLQDDNPFYLQVVDDAPYGDSTTYKVSITAVGALTINGISITTKAFFG